MKKWICMTAFLLGISPVQSQTIFRVPSEYPTIQAAIDEVWCEQDIILIAPGTYTGAGNQDMVIDGKTVTLRGDGKPEEIIINAGGSEVEVHNLFNITGYSWAETRMRNLTLQGSWGKSCIKGIEAYILLESCIVRDNLMAPYGGGVFLWDGVLFSFNTTFQNNHSFGSGGAVWARNVSLSNCVFEDNYAGNQGGGLFAERVSEITNCEFRNNEAQWDGGGASLQGDANIFRTLFESNTSYNYGGGCHFYLGSYLKMDMCRIVGNSSALGGGGEIYNWIECDITNCIFAENEASYEGGGFAIGGVFWGSFINNTIYGNNAAAAGGGIRLNQIYNLEFVNCINWDNSASQAPELYLTDQDFPGSEANVYISNCILEESETLISGENHHLSFGERIIPINPDLSDPEAGNYQLSFRSVCVDNGRSSDVPDCDISGFPRPIGNGIDIGAYEYQTPLTIGTHLYMEDTNITTGDKLTLEMLNATGDWGKPVVKVLVLEVGGAFYFYPDWLRDFSYEEVTIEYGRQWQEILSFIWPDNSGSGSGLCFWGAILNPDDFTTIGEIDSVNWCYY